MKIESIKPNEQRFNSAIEAADHIHRQTKNWLYADCPYVCSYAGEGRAALGHLRHGIYFIRSEGLRHTIYFQGISKKVWQTPKKVVMLWSSH
jgi:hypothetical protein